MPVIHSLLHQVLPKSVRRFINKLVGRNKKFEKQKQAAIIGFKEFCIEAPKQKALVSYLVSPLLPLSEQRDKIQFSNGGIAQYIPQVLNELGYEVDIIQWDNTSWKPDAKYDLFIGHGGINFEKISRNLPSETVRIYFATGLYWKELNCREAQRLCDLAVRTGYLLPPDRYVQHSEEYANKVADGIICLGNQVASQSYCKFPLVIGINNGVYPIVWADGKKKDYEAGRQHFFFFSGSGNIHKGLDILLEAFVQTELHLHICQSIDVQFEEVYRRELTEYKNIHVHGGISMRSLQFNTLALQCNWIITATCGEGQPGAVLECMGYGLIPILPDSANIDLGKFGLRMEDCTVNGIHTLIQKAAKMPVNECKERSRFSAEIIKREYSPEQFSCNLKTAIQKVTSVKAKNFNENHCILS